MSTLMNEWRVKKAQEEEQLLERLRAAVADRRVDVFTDQRMLDFQGSPVHNSWDHLLPLLVLMTLAMVILLATGVAIGIVAMTLGALTHLLAIKHFVAWRIRARAQTYMLQSAAHMNHLWQLGGIALVMQGGNEPPCLAPRGDWRKFTQRNLHDSPAPSAAEEAVAPDHEVLPP